MNSKIWGKGKDIIFLHGWGGDGSAFLFVAKQLAKSFRVTVLDFPSFGNSPPPDRAYGVCDFADEVAELMRGYGIKSATVVGHSFGGRVAIELASHHTELVDALVLIDSAGIKPRRGLKYYFKISIHKILKKLGFKGLKGSSDYSRLSPLMQETFKKVVNYDQTPSLDKILQPTAIFWGREDKVTPAYMAKTLKKNIKNSELFWLKGGHFAYLEDSAYFYAVLYAFVNAENNSIQKSEKGYGGKSS